MTQPCSSGLLTCELANMYDLLSFICWTNWPLNCFLCCLLWRWQGRSRFPRWWAEGSGFHRSFERFVVVCCWRVSHWTKMPPNNSKDGTHSNVLQQSLSDGEEQVMDELQSQHNQWWRQFTNSPSWFHSCQMLNTVWQRLKEWAVCAIDQRRSGLFTHAHVLMEQSEDGESRAGGLDLREWSKVRRGLHPTFRDLPISQNWKQSHLWLWYLYWTQ